MSTAMLCGNEFYKLIQLHFMKNQFLLSVLKSTISWRGLNFLWLWYCNLLISLLRSFSSSMISFSDGVAKPAHRISNMGIPKMFINWPFSFHSLFWCFAQFAFFHAAAYWLTQHFLMSCPPQTIFWLVIVSSGPIRVLLKFVLHKYASFYSHSTFSQTCWNWRDHFGVLYNLLWFTASW